MTRAADAGRDRAPGVNTTSADPGSPGGPDPSPSGSGSGADEGAPLGDVLVAAAVGLAAPLAFALHPDGSLFRALAVLPGLLLAPGYLLLQTVVVPRAPAGERARHAALALGVSFPVLGLAVLGAALSPWGMRPVPIVVAVTAANLGLAGWAASRRVRAARSASGAEAPTPIHIEGPT